MNEPEAFKLSARRADLAQQQAELLRALVAGGPPPPGFDAHPLAVCSRSLLYKRLRETERVWPALAECLGGGWNERFLAHARAHSPCADGPAGEGLRFAWTIPRAELDDAARREILFAELARRRVACRLAWLPESGRLVLAFRLPWFGVRVAWFRARRRRTPGESPPRGPG